MKKLIHKLKATSLRHKLIRQRAQNIADIRRGRYEARAIRRELIRHSRLANPGQPAFSTSNRPADTFQRDFIGNRLREVVQSVPRPTKRAA